MYNVSHETYTLSSNNISKSSYRHSVELISNEYTKIILYIMHHNVFENTNIRQNVSHET